MSDAITRLNRALKGRYLAERQIGEGGMAVVYLAKDLRHDRDVALKVLKPQLVAVVGADRFLGEIQTTAKLQHPHILPLFDSGEADGFLYFVMPYVRGESLRDRLNRDGQLPVSEAVRIATAVANALQAAHEQGIVHRDVKPANILLSDGEPLVADFGIALATRGERQARLTETGMSLGTPYYMSPEQATGDQSLGPAADIYALGCVLYEMLVGEPPYLGNTTQAILVKIMQSEPISATRTRKSIPPNVDAAIRKALEKIPADRFRLAKQFAEALHDPSFRHGDKARAGRSGGWGLWNPLSVGAAAAAVFFAAIASWALVRPGPSAGPERFESPFRAGQEPVDFSSQAFALSGDGSFLVYRGPSNEATARLWVRHWSDLEGRAIRSTDGAVNPSVSPDGTEIAYEQGAEIRVVPVEGGPIRTLGTGRRPIWGSDGFIYFSGAAGLMRTPPAEGSGEVVAGLDEGHAQYVPSHFDAERGAVWIDVLQTDGLQHVGSVDLATGAVTVVAPGAFPKRAPTGHLVFVSQGRLVGAHLERASAELASTPTPLIESVSAYAISESGRLFYAAVPEEGTSEFVWVTRSGRATPVDAGWSLDIGGSGNIGWNLSPDDSKLALRRQTGAGSDIWIKELDDGPLSRLTVHPAEDLGPRWTPDGERVTFLSDRNTDLEVWSRRADLVGEAELLLDYTGRLVKAIISPDERWIVLRRAGLSGGSEGERDILAAQLGVDAEPLPIVASPVFAEQAPALSPDGAWLAYSSNETGRNEVFVRPFPNVEDGKHLISTDGGILPVWAHSGDELFFVAPSSREMISVRVRTTPAFQVEAVERLFTIPIDYTLPQNGDPYDVTSDDQRFIMARVFQSGGAAAQRVILVTGFAQELERLVPR